MTKDGWMMFASFVAFIFTGFSVRTAWYGVFDSYASPYSLLLGFAGFAGFVIAWLVIGALLRYIPEQGTYSFGRLILLGTAYAHIPIVVCEVFPVVSDILEPIAYMFLVVCPMLPLWHIMDLLGVENVFAVVAISGLIPAYLAFYLKRCFRAGKRREVSRAILLDIERENQP